MKPHKGSVIVLWLAAVISLFAGLPARDTLAKAPTDLLILQKWRGDYPVAQLDRLPQGKTNSGVGYIDEPSLFEGIWQAFKPGEPLPQVDFGTQIVVFNHNVAFYNRINIVKVSVEDGIAQIIAIETRSALPIEDKVAMSMAMIPRTGIKFIQAGTERIAVAPRN